MSLIAFIRHHVSSIIIGAFLLGLVTPGLGNTPPWVTLSCLSGIIFFSCFQIDTHAVKAVSVKASLVFYVFRFLILPVLLFYGFNPWSTTIATAVLLSALMPTGVSASGIAYLCHANVALVFFILLLSSGLAPFTVPIVMSLLIEQDVALDTMGLFKALLATLFIPFLAHLPFRKFDRSQAFFSEYSAAIVVVLIALQVVNVVGGFRDEILENMSDMGVYLAVAVIAVGSFYAIGSWFGKRQSPENHRAFCLSSGINNSIMATVLASVYFEPSIGIALIVFQIAWILSLSVATLYSKHRLSD